jgi:EF hand
MAGSGSRSSSIYQRQRSGLFKVVSEAMDQDGDGFIDQGTYLRMLGLVDVDRESVLAGFHRLDSDGDGKITTSEFQEGAGHASLSQDPADPEPQSWATPGSRSGGIRGWPSPGSARPWISHRKRPSRRRSNLWEPWPLC